MIQLAISAIDNKNLFSNYYLDNQIKNNTEWKKEEHKAVFSEIKKLYDTEKDFLPNLNEKQLEQRFFAPIFKILNYTAEPNAPTEHQEFPDYAFFHDRNSLDDAHKKKGTISFYNNAFAIGEVKRWGIELDRFGRDDKDRKRNPSLQIWIYLHDVSPKWGVLSNGAKWRLYCKDRRRDDYYEVDLPTLLAKDEPKNVEDFKYFYYFFRKDAFGIPKSELYVPAYNGGLFEPDKNPELEKWVVGDALLADAIDLLSRSKVNGGRLDFVDYSTLEIRHLGSIYEGLLEYKLRIADEDMVVNGGEWVNISDYNKDRKQKKVFSDFDVFDRVKKGQLYLATDKGERKATGSYYTPDYIVNYIVKNTVGPVVEEKWKEALANKKSFMDATLSVKVLDPAMGSGHFLVGSIEFLAGKLLVAAQKDIEAGRLSEDAHLTPDWARREVVAHCIYGVDLNDLAVELAKVSLWLTTISKDKPLSFLDHRLKQGNSLIGARLTDLKHYPNGTQKDKDQTTLPSFVSPWFIKHLIGKIKELEEIKEDSLSDIKKKEKVFEEFKALPQYIKAKAIANVHTAVYFGNEVEQTKNKSADMVYHDLFWAVGGDDAEWLRKTKGEWFMHAQEISREKSFFQWELEFPEIFFEGGAPKENPGWDAVVGNPPYDVLSAKERGEEEEKFQYELDYFKRQISGFSGKLNLYRLMSERSYSYLRDSGRFGFIIPNTVMADQSSAPLRKFLFENSKEISFLEFPEKARVFTDVTQAVCILVAQKGTPKAEEIFLATGLKTGSDLLAPKFFNLKLKEILEIDGEYYLPYVSEKSIDLFRNLLNFPRTGNLSDLSIFQGEVNLTNYKECIKTNDGAQLIRGDHLSRYELIFNTEKPSYLDVQCYLTKAGDAEKAKHHKSQRIAFQEVANMQLSRRLNATLVEQNQFLGHTTNYFMVKNNYSIYFILALFNSQLLNWRFKLTSTTNHVSGDEVRRLPIRRISFTTPPDRRAALVEQAKALYSAFVGAPDRDDHAFKCGDFVSARLSAAPEESDVVHDLLAHLAERMIEMNKEKNVEIKGFLRWLEGEIGAPVKELTNKTAIREYYLHDFDAFAGALVKNKKKLKEGYDPTRREPKERLQTEFNASVGKLAPLLERIEATDRLIDAIVYRLYGLTADEIKIVEESIKTTGSKGISEES